LRSFHTTDALRLGLALPSTGNNIAARIAMIAITTSNSIKVKRAMHARGTPSLVTDSTGV